MVPVRVFLSLALPGCLAGAALAADANGDTLASPACRDALAQLEQHERALDTRGGDRQAWQQARRQAAVACLGHDEAPAPQHLAQPPVRVAPVTVPPAPRPHLDVPAPVRIAPAAPAATITSCDAAGCWASDGTRWQRNGPDLVGPRGLCTVVGQQLRCP